MDKPPVTMMEPRSLWAVTAGNDVVTVPLSGERHADVVVVGGGFTGLRAALETAANGADTVVLETACVGWGASGRSGGQVNPLPHNTPEIIAKQLPAAVAQNFVQTTMRAADDLFEFIDRHGITCQARQNGWLRVAHNSRAAATMRRDYESWRLVGADVTLLEKNALADYVGSDFYKLGLLFNRGGCIQPLAYVRGLARCAQRAGAVIHTDSQAVSIKQVNEKWIVSTADGRIVARSVILCVNGYVDALYPPLARSIVPLVSIQTATVPLPEEIIKHVLPHDQTIADTRLQIFYGRREPDNRVIFGTLGRMDRNGRLSNFDALQATATAVFPALKNTRWEYEWGGCLAKTADYLPHLHELAPGLLAGLGYNGRGVAMAQVMGLALANRVLGQSNDLLPTAPLQPYPFSGLTKLAINTGLSWMTHFDRLKKPALATPKS